MNFKNSIFAKRHVLRISTVILLFLLISACITSIEEVENISYLLAEDSIEHKVIYNIINDYITLLNQGDFISAQALLYFREENYHNREFMLEALLNDPPDSLDFEIFYIRRLSSSIYQLSAVMIGGYGTDMVTPWLPFIFFESEDSHFIILNRTDIPERLAHNLDIEVHPDILEWEDIVTLD